MIFIRHNRLVPPYDNYATLALNELDALATGMISPEIMPLPERLPFDEHIITIILQADTLVCSTSKRTQQTCKNVLEKIGVNKEFDIDPDLDEIFFQPSRFEILPSSSPLETVRQNLYASILAHETYVEDKIHLQNRLTRVIAKYKSEKCVLFSHGFLIRLMRAYALCGNDLAQALPQASSLPHVDYLGVLEI